MRDSKSFLKMLNEEIDERENKEDISNLITYTLYLISQVHIWHLLCPSGQKHTALGELYNELQSAVDVLAERFIALGGKLSPLNISLVTTYSDLSVIKAIKEYREMTVKCISQDPSQQSINDAVIDLQEIADSKLYKFNLN